MHTGRVNYWTGVQGREFEQEFAAASDCENALALTNGTAALELALRSLDIGTGNEVVTSSRTFIASESCNLQNDFPLRESSPRPVLHSWRIQLSKTPTSTMSVTLSRR